MKRIRFLLQTLLQKRQADLEMDAEMRSHVQMQIQQNVEARMKPEEARWTALREFGSIQAVKEVCREQRGFYRARRATKVDPMISLRYE